MARIIAEAGVRLVADRKGLAASIRREFGEAVREATAGSSLFRDVDRDSDDSARRVGSTWRRTFAGLKTSVGGFVGVLGGLSKMLLIGTAAAGAVAGVVSLSSAVASLGAALVTASGVAGLLPAIFAGLAAVNITLKLGLSGVSEGFKAIGEDAATFNEAIKNLAPNAQSFLRALREQKGAFDDLRLGVQNRLFLGLADVIKPLAQTYLPLADRLFTTIAGSLNNAAHSAADFALEGRTVGEVGGLVDNLRLSVINLAPAFRPALSALLDITSVGSTFLPGMSSAITQASQKFGEFIRHAAETGQLQAFFERAIETVKQLGRIIGNVFGTLGNVLNAAQSQGGGLLNTIESITAKFKEWTGSTAGQEALKSFFASIQRVISALGPAFFSLIQIIGRDFIPILADIAEVIGPVLRPLFEVLGSLLQALRPLIQALAGAFATALAALEPFFQALAEAINGAMPDLLPLISDIGEAFANLFEALVPLAPVFVDLVAAVLPLIPPLINMVAEILPEIIDLIKAVLPLVQAWVDSMVFLIPIITDVANFLLNVFIPVIQAVVFVITGFVNIVKGALSDIWNDVVAVLGAIGSFFASVWNDITTQVSNAWNAITSFFANGISGIVSKVGQWASDMWNRFTTAMSNIASAVAAGIGNVVQWFIDLPGRIFSAVAGIASWLFNAGRDLVMGLINGIKDMARRAVEAVKGVINDAINAAKALLGIGSPSKVFAEIGRDLGRGMVRGLVDITPAVADAANALAGVTTAGVTDPFGAGQGAVNGVRGAAGGTVINQTNVMQAGSDIKQFSDTVLRRGMGDFLSGASTLTVVRNGVQAGVNDRWVGV